MYSETQLADGIVTRLLGDSDDIPIDDETILQFVEKFGIEEPLVDNFIMMLVVGVMRYNVVKEWSLFDWPSIKDELSVLADPDGPQLKALNTRSANVQTVLIDSGFWRALGNAPSPAIVEVNNKTDKSARHVLYADNLGTTEAPEIDLNSFSDIEAALSKVAKNAKFLAPKGTGRKSNDAVFELMLWSFHAWTTAAKKPFKLRWFDDSAPNTPTTDFLLEFANAVDITITPQQIVTAARKVKKNCKPLNNLQELDDFVWNCCETLL